MKLDMIRNQLQLCEQSLEQGQPQQAAEAACLTARLLLMRAAQWQTEAEALDVQKALIALVGVAGAIEERLRALTSLLPAADLAAKLNRRLAQLREETAGMEEVYQQLTAVNEAILGEETALRERKQELTALRAKLMELMDIKENQIRQLQAEVKEQQEKLAKLEANYIACQALYDDVEKELEENLRILTQLPETTGESTLDALIAQGKQTRETLESARETGSEPIRRIIEEVRKLRALAEGTA